MDTRRAPSVTGTEFRVDWDAAAPPLGQHWIYTSGLYLHEDTVVPIRSTTRVEAVATATHILGAHLEQELSLNGSEVLLGEFTVLDSAGQSLGKRLAAVWSSSERSLWCDIEGRSSEWIVDLFASLEPDVVHGVAVPTAARPGDWLIGSTNCVMTVDGLGTFDFEVRRNPGRSTERGAPTQAGEVFRNDTSDDDPSLVLITDDVRSHLHHFEVDADTALEAVEHIESVRAVSSW